MRNIIEINNKKAYFKYDGSSPVSTLENIMCYMKLEEINLSQMDLGFPFYYTKEYRWLKIKQGKTILKQIYEELNTLHEKFNNCKFLIIKLNCEFVEPIIDMEIFPIIDKESCLGDKVRLKCENMFDYSDLCVFNSGNREGIYLHDAFKPLYSENDLKFLEILPFLNCGITRFEGDKILPIHYWDAYYDDEYKTDDEFDLDED